MYDIAVSVDACLRAGTRVDLAWVVEVRGFSSRSRGEALAVTPGGGRLGSIMSGALDDQLAWLLAHSPGRRLVEVQVSDTDAAAAGLSCGGLARCMLVPADELPAELWARLLRREPVCLVSRLEGDRIVASEIFTAETIGQAGADAERLFSRGVGETAVLDDSVVTALWPVPRLVVVGAGVIGDALDAAARQLDWSPQIVTDVATASALVAGLSSVDGLVVISHDHELGCPALAAALDGSVGYIGALGSRHTQQARAQWLAQRGITDTDVQPRIHGPAGLDIGAHTPAEIAVSIVAEMIATRSGMTPGSLRDRPGPIHRDAVAAPLRHAD